MQAGKDAKSKVKAGSEGKDAKAAPQLPASVKTAPAVKASPSKPDPKAEKAMVELKKEIERKQLEIQKQKCGSGVVKWSTWLSWRGIQSLGWLLLVRFLCFLVCVGCFCCVWLVRCWVYSASLS